MILKYFIKITQNELYFNEIIHGVTLLQIKGEYINWGSI